MLLFSFSSISTAPTMNHQAARRGTAVLRALQSLLSACSFRGLCIQGQHNTGNNEILDEIRRLREEVRENINELREEVREYINELREEVRDNKNELRENINELRENISGLRAYTYDNFSELNKKIWGLGKYTHGSFIELDKRIRGLREYTHGSFSDHHKNISELHEAIIALREDIFTREGARDRELCLLRIRIRSEIHALREDDAASEENPMVSVTYQIQLWGSVFHTVFVFISHSLVFL
jgi:DNA repair exonuclease SbcCD ATPase subunit